MARQSRNAAAQVAHLVMQRGHNGSALFRDGADRAYMRETLSNAARDHQVALHAYAMPDDTLVLLVTPQEAQALSRFMQSIGRRYARHVNSRYQRTGGLYDGRFRCALVQAGEPTLEVMLYIDSLSTPEHTSMHHYQGQVTDRLLTAPPAYWRLGNTPYARELAYVQRSRAGLSNSRQRYVEAQLFKNHAIGDAGFVSEMELLTGLRLHASHPGRPRKQGSA